MWFQGGIVLISGSPIRLSDQIDTLQNRLMRSRNVSESPVSDRRSAAMALR